MSPIGQASYNDAKLDTLSRSVYYDVAEAALTHLRGHAHDDETLLAYAVALDAAACGFKDDDEESDADIPAGLRQPSPYNDDLLNEKSRSVFVECMTHVQQYIKGDKPMNTDRLHAYARLADAAACGFKEDEEGDD